MVVTYSYEMLADFQGTLRCYVPEDITLHYHCRENLKSYIVLNYLPNMKNSYFVRKAVMDLAVLLVQYDNF
jgi:hypothetical protein